MRQIGVCIAIVIGLATFLHAETKFDSTWESLEQWECPDWFRDAKLGIFMHWSPVSVPAYDDWYPRNMYIEGHPAYLFHVKNYGHPSKFGYKDILPLWKAEKFDPDKLATLYREIGAKYIVPVATHHDNYDMWDSAHHRWNSVRIGPKKDILGMWRKAVLREGMRFGASFHLARSYSWFNVNKGSDKRGPLAGVPYDGADLKNADFYHKPHPDTDRRYPINPSAEWQQIWLKRCMDLVSKYKPDLLYFDGAIPFGEIGREAVAHLYNTSIEAHDGELEAVLNIKNRNRGRDGQFLVGTAVLDVERGMLAEIRPEVWQTDTSIGPWFYMKGEKYKSPDAIVDAFVDIVSKNGNMLLNVPLRADGSLDKEGEDVLRAIGRWLKVNGEAIYGTRYWKVHGEGPTTFGAGYGQERTDPFRADDIRFTTKDGDLYVICLDWPGAGATVSVKSLSSLEERTKIERITLLGADGQVTWSQDEDALRITVPSRKPCEYAYCFKVQFAR